MAMGESKKVVFEFDGMERGWLLKALELQRAALLRSRGREVAGSDIWTLRGKEIEALTSLRNRFY